MNHEELRKMAEGATPGKWDIDTTYVDGECCIGDQGVINRWTGYKIICNGKSILDTINSEATVVDYDFENDGEGGSLYAWDSEAKSNLEFIAAANPKQVIALLDEIKAKDAYIAELEASLPDERFLGEIMIDRERNFFTYKFIDCHQKDLEGLPVGTKIYAHMEKKP
jgi:hypothetical protein